MGSSTMARQGTVQARGKAQTAKRTAAETAVEWVKSILFAVLAALVLRIFVIEAYRIPTGSMKDTLLIGDFLLVNKFIYGVRTPDHIPILNVSIPHFRLPALRQPKPGEIVVFKYPLNMRMNYIKRCIAIGGQTVEIRHGEVYIDGKPEGTKEYVGKEYDPEEGRFVLLYRVRREDGRSYIIRRAADVDPTFENWGPVKVPEGHYFMMGDNRDNSQDSRYWGFLPHDNVVGKAMIIYWSWDSVVPIYNIAKKVRWGRIGHIIR
jgi:signal peptidase I